jgi:hypothetical protein
MIASNCSAGPAFATGVGCKEVAIFSSLGFWIRFGG